VFSITTWLSELGSWIT